MKSKDLIKTFKTLISKNSLESSQAYQVKLVETLKPIFNNMKKSSPDWDKLFEEFRQKQDEFLKNQKELFVKIQSDELRNLDGFDSHLLLNPALERLAFNNPGYFDILRRPIIEFQNKKFENLGKDTYEKIKKESEIYLNQTLDLKKKLNTKASISLMKLINNKENEKIYATGKVLGFLGKGAFYERKKGTLLGTIYGRGAVLVYRRKKNGTGYHYELEKPTVTDIKYNIPTFPEFEEFKDSEMKNFKDFDYEVEERDIVLLVTSKVIDNIPLNVINYLVNFATFNMATNKNWKPSEDKLIALFMDNVIKKLSSLQNIRYSFKTITGSTAFGKEFETEEFPNSPIGKCSLWSLYPNLASSTRQFLSKLNFVNLNKCPQKIIESKFTITGEARAETTNVDLLSQNFDSAKISTVLTMAIKYFLEATKQKEKGSNQPPIILTFKQIDTWNKAINGFKKNKNSHFKFITEIKPDHFLQETNHWKYQPANGDYLLYADMLVEAVPKVSELTCTEILDKDGANLAKVVKDFYEKATGKEIIEEDSDLVNAELIQSEPSITDENLV